MRWTEASFTNGQPPPSPRSGHSATVVNGGEDVVVFGGLHTSNFIGETVVLSLSEGRWWRPPSAAVGGPGPRAFHCAVAVDLDLPPRYPLPRVTRRTRGAIHATQEVLLLRGGAPVLEEANPRPGRGAPQPVPLHPGLRKV